MAPPLVSLMIPGIELTFGSSSDLPRTRPQSVKVIVEFQVIETAHTSVC